MNAHIFDNHSSVTCPICHRNGNIKPGQMWGGLYTCPYCQARLVISWSGHYVRDPFNLKQVAVGRLLRRQSRPLARILRDVGLTRRPTVIAVLAGAMVASVTFAMMEGWIFERNPFQGWLERLNEVIELPEKSG